MAFFALGVAMAYITLSHVWQRVILVLLAVPTAVFVNILRVMTLGLLSIADKGFVTGDFHTFIGTLWLVPAFLIYLGIVWVLKNVIIEEEDEKEVLGKIQPIRFMKSAGVGFMVIIALLSTAAVGFQIGVQQLNIYLHKEAVYPRRDLAVIPTLAGKWQSIGEDKRMDKAGVEALGTEIYLNRTYDDQLSSTPAVQLHIAYYTGQIDAVPHVPDRCMVAGGFVPLTAEPINIPFDVGASLWKADPEYALDETPYPFVTKKNRVTGKDEIIHMPLGEFEIRTTQFSHPQLGDDQVFAGYFFVANGKTTAYPERIRLLAFDPSSKYAYYCKIQLTIRGSQNFTVDDFRILISELLSELMPEIMACLPDWPEVTEQYNNTNNE